MLLTEYDEIAHINNEKDISFKEGQLQMLDIMKRINAGESCESILSTGVDRQTLEAVVSLMKGAK